MSKIQIEGFSKCLSVWYHRQFGRYPEGTLLLKEHLKQIPLVELPKIFKGILCWNFSVLTSQEIPNVPEQARVPIVNLFQSNFDKQHIRTRLQSPSERVTRKLKALWGLLQCKSLSNPVPTEFRQDAYEKHRKSMSISPGHIRADLLEEFEQFIEPFIQGTVELYKDRTRIPNQHATLMTTRSSGGTRGELKDRITPSTFIKDDPQLRIDPVVLHLQGAPGTGKSFSVRRICQHIGKAFGYMNVNEESFRDWTYFRSAHSRHWDGYRNQLITVIDDFGATSIEKQLEETTKEMMLLSSECDYIVPMADLRDKGRRFTSKFLILTTNKGIDHRASHSTVDFQEPLAFLRRMSPTYMFDLPQESLVTVPKALSFFERLSEEPVQETKAPWTRVDGHVRKLNIDLPHTDQYHGFYYSDYLWKQEWTYPRYRALHTIVSEALTTYQKRVNTHSPTWFQEICRFPGSQLGLRMNTNPPSRTAKVRASCVVEALKARIITCPEAETYCLKPLQLSMLECLKRWKCFKPCFTPDYDDLLPRRSKDQKWLSGDYSAATDELNWFVSQAVIRSLSSRFRERGLTQLADWIEFEGGEHIVEYPPSANLPPVRQANGQLMGSLLSFPILCIVNAFTVCRAKSQSLDDCDGLIHGDDLLVAMKEGEFRSWSRLAPILGLKLSMGKNYFSKQFASIDSQLFLDSEGSGSLTRSSAGKFKLVSRKIDESLTCAPAIRAGFSKRMIRHYCSEQLKSTVRSLHIPETHGGLSTEFEANYVPTVHEKLVYLALLERKTKPRQISERVFMVEKSVARTYGLPTADSSTLEGVETEQSEAMLRRRVHQLCYRFNKFSSYAKFVKNLDLRTARPLNLFKTVPTLCAGIDLGIIENAMRSTAGLNRLTLGSSLRVSDSFEPRFEGTDMIRRRLRLHRI